MKYKLGILFSVLVLLLCVCSFYSYFHRFDIKEPMLDVEYKKAIILDSKNPFYRLENMRPILGEDEFIQFVKENSNNPEIYNPSEENIENGIFRANLHMHTLKSDGKVSVQQRLDAAQEYAEQNIKNGYMYIAITDHNTVLGAKEVVRVLQKNPNKYKNIKVVLGMETYAAFTSKYFYEPIEIHVLHMCINPYDEFLNREFFKSKFSNMWNRTLPDRIFDFTISYMSKYSVPIIAHPIRYTDVLEKEHESYFDELLSEYKKLSKKPLIIEGYYHSYPKYYDDIFIEEYVAKYSDYVNKKADEMGILKTGSTDAHEESMF